MVNVPFYSPRLPVHGGGGVIDLSSKENQTQIYLAQALGQLLANIQKGKQQRQVRQQYGQVEPVLAKEGDQQANIREALAALRTTQGQKPTGLGGVLDFFNPLAPARGGGTELQQALLQMLQKGQMTPEEKLLQTYKLEEERKKAYPKSLADILDQMKGIEGYKKPSIRFGQEGYEGMTLTPEVPVLPKEPTPPGETTGMTPDERNRYLEGIRKIKTEGTPLEQAMARIIEQQLGITTGIPGTPGMTTQGALELKGITAGGVTFAKPEEAKAIPTETLAGMDAIKTIKQLTDDIGKLYKDEYVGPVGGRIRGVTRALKGIGKEEEEFRRNTNMVGQLLAYALSGKQISAQEMTMLKENAPNVNMPPETFKSNLAAFKKLINQMLTQKQTGLKQAGYKVSETQTDDISKMSDEELKKIAGIK